MSPAGPIGSAIGGIGGLIAGLLPSGPTVTNTNQNTNTQGETNTSGSSNQNFTQFLTNLLNTVTQGGTTGTSTTSPNLSPATQQLIDSLTSKYQALSAPSLTGYQAQQTQGINRASDLQSQAVNNIMASRGLATSPAAGTAQAGVESQRFGQINQLAAGLPLLQNQLNLSNLGAASSFAASMPHGTTTTSGSTNTQGTTQNQSQNTGGQSYANQFGYTGTNQSTNATGTQTTQQKGSASAGIAGLLAGLFSDVRLKKEIKPIDRAIDKLMALRPVSWKWKGSEIEDAGLLAQDIEKVLPELIDKTDSSGYLKVNYAGLIGTLVGAIQDLKSEATV